MRTILKKEMQQIQNPEAPESAINEQNASAVLGSAAHIAPTKPAIAAIVPAYNEASRIGRVLQTLLDTPAVTEIIVVDDGSSDGTVAEVQALQAADARLRLVQHVRNQGKGQALYTGWQATRAPFLVFLDADLVNLKPEHVLDLIQPVIAGQADMTMGVFESGYWRSDLTQQLTPWLTGQRCLRSRLMEQIHWKAAAGYGFETAITLTASRQQWRSRRVALRGVTHMMGDLPHGAWRGPLNKLKMFKHIGRAWFELEDWSSLGPRLIRRTRLTFVMLLAAALSLVNSCSVNTSFVTRRMLMSLTNDDALWVFWGKLKTALDLLQ